MGHVKKILAHLKIQPSPKFYSDKLAIELAENFHLHVRNVRLELDHVEFEKIAKAFCDALKKWKKLGRPSFKKYKEKGDTYYLLGESKLSPVPSLFNNELNNDDLRIEIQKWADCIHVHYKELRFELSVDEFKELVETVAKAGKLLEQYSEENPKRLGIFQRACPHGRVDTGATGFWTQPSDNDETQPFATTYEEEDMKIMADERFTDNPKLMKLDVRDLFDITLFHSKDINPWGCDDEGVFLPLLHRYQFAKMVFEAGGEPSNEQIKATNYWKLLQRGVNERPRDGGTNWVFKDPMAQCQRAVALAKAIKQHGYLGADKAHPSYQDWEKTPEIIMEDGQVTFLVNNEAGFPGLISVKPASGAYKVHNGLHRLAILKYLWDTGQLPTPRILVRKWDDSPFSPEDIEDISYDEKSYPSGNTKLSYHYIERKTFGKRLKQRLYRGLRPLLSRVRS